LKGRNEEIANLKRQVEERYLHIGFEQISLFSSKAKSASALLSKSRSTLSGEDFIDRSSSALTLL